MTTDHQDPARRERYAEALRECGVYDNDERLWRSLSPEWIEEITTAVLAIADAETTELRALAADATEYRVHLPDNGGTTLLARRQNLAHGTGWAVSVPAHGGGRAWTTEGWQESISALSVDRLFCWPDATTAITEGRRASTA